MAKSLLYGPQSSVALVAHTVQQVGQRNRPRLLHNFSKNSHIAGGWCLLLGRDAKVWAR